MIPQEFKIYIKLGIGLFVLLIILLLNPWTSIGAGERGVVTKFGQVEDRILEPGLHFVIPFIEKVHKIDVQIQKEQVNVSAASKDLQTVKATVALNFNVDPITITILFQQVGRDYGIRIIDPAIQEAVKAITSQFTAEELITKRPVVKEQLLALVKERLSRNNIIADDVSIVNFDFSESFNAAIEAKVTAEQNALAAKNKLEQVKFEAEQRISLAKGEAEAIRIQAQAIQQQGGEAYVQLQAISKWKGDVPTYLMGNSVPFINLK
jgi:regulator of protease activity HflC (stomatin/prohibitin superfamily)